MRLYLACVLTSALALEPITAPSRIAMLLDEVPTVPFLDAIAHGLPLTAEPALASRIAQLRCEREPFKKALRSSDDSDS